MIASLVRILSRRVFLGLTVCIDFISWFWVYNTFIVELLVIWHYFHYWCEPYPLCGLSYHVSYWHIHPYLAWLVTLFIQGCSVMCLFYCYSRCKELKWECILPSIANNLAFVCHHKLWHALDFILRCCMFEFFLWWISCWSISLSAYDLVL